MTIAIGRLCTTGLIIAADTRMTWDDGSTYDATKIKSQMTNSGVYVIAHSSEDANAADSLVAEILRELSRIDPKSLVEFEEHVKPSMKAWYAAYTSSPSMKLIVGVFIPPNSASPNADSLGLYLCEPPTTVARKMPLDSSKGYIAIGAGPKITDPLFHTLFERPVSVRVCLEQISYLMYRAKKDCGAYCGGETDAVFLKSVYAEPPWIKRLDMKVGESFGQLLDTALARTASVIIPEAYATNPKSIVDLAADISSTGLGYIRLQFYSETGELVA
jgi:hypothetical protein